MNIEAGTPPEDSVDSPSLADNAGNTGQPPSDAIGKRVPASTLPKEFWDNLLLQVAVNIKSALLKAQQLGVKARFTDDEAFACALASCGIEMFDVELVEKADDPDLLEVKLHPKEELAFSVQHGKIHICPVGILPDGETAIQSVGRS